MNDHLLTCYVCWLMSCASWTLGVGPGQIQIPQTAPELCTSPIQNYVKYNLAQITLYL